MYKQTKGGVYEAAIKMDSGAMTCISIYIKIVLDIGKVMKTYADTRTQRPRLS
jgi:hypothetical protein